MIIKRPIFENLSQTTANEMLSRFNEVIKTLKAQRYEEYEDDRRYDTTIYPVIDEFQKVTALAVFSRDITEARLAEIELKRHSEELEKANKELEQFAYVASHDLQEPLRTISSHVQLIQRRLEGQLDERARKSIGFVVEGAKRMQGLINDLLQYSRVGTRAKEPEPTDSNDSLRLALDNLEAFIKDTDAKVESDELPVVMADSAQLVQIFQNLIENGIKFRGEEQPIVSISATRRDDMWEFSVKDNGIGLDPKFEDRIFEIFQRLHGVGKYSGSGIGLAICKKIVERHGGTMWVNSEPGKGATFSFTLPGTVEGEAANGAG
jgi:light-regulated signal transduction histidine kinase (bacteriophytochrome)